MVIDGHVHFFGQRIIDNVSEKTAMVAELGLEVGRARNRIGRGPLEAAVRRAGVDACLVLPTASKEKIRKANTAALSLAAQGGFIRTAGTLHPGLGNIGGELRRLHQGGIRAIKMSSFSQRFSLDAPDFAAMLASIQSFNQKQKAGFFLVLDTFFTADVHFDAPPAHVTTPHRLARRVRQFPGIAFVAAHMGGLAAPPERILDELTPAPNLFLDTANAAHTLDAESFVRLISRHGPERIIFGTDWPWFDPGDEMGRIAALLDRAGFTGPQQARVFGMNMAELLEMTGP